MPNLMSWRRDPGQWVRGGQGCAGRLWGICDFVLDERRRKLRG